MAQTTLPSFLPALEEALQACQVSANVGTSDSQTVQTVIDVLSMARHLGTNLHSQCTKLSLALKPPQTADAVKKCMQDIDTLLPVFSALCQILRPEKHSTALCEKVRSQCRYALLGLKTLLNTSDEISSTDFRLSNTGILWEACVELQKLGTPSVLVAANLTECSQMIGDAIEDLDSWLSGDIDFNISVTESSSEAGDQEINPLAPDVDSSELDQTKRRIAMLKRIQILLSAIGKRKVNEQATITYLNTVYENCAKLSVEVDDLAVEIQEEADFTFISELEKAVVLRVEEILNSAPADDKDEKWAKWSHVFKEKWLDQLKPSVNSCPIQYYSRPPPHEDFLTNNLTKLQPCLIDRLTIDWPCSRDWVLDVNDSSPQPDISHLRATYGSTPVSATEASSASPKTLLFSTFLDDVAAGKHGYARDIHLVHKFPNSNFYTCPDLFQDDWLNFKLVHEGKEDYKFVYMGTDSTETKLHKDVVASHSWSTNLTGHKIWTLIPPSVSQFLFTFDREEVISDIYASDPITQARWPKLAQVREAAITVHQKPGETIFVPSTWYHQVKNIEVTLSINHNWINAVSLLSVFDNLTVEVEMSAEAVKDLKEDCRVTDRGFAEVVQDLTLANAGMNWKTFFELILFRIEHESEYIPARLRPSKEYETGVVIEVCDKWILQDEAQYLSEVAAMVDKTRNSWREVSVR